MDELREDDREGETGILILVVDDDPDLRTTIEDVLGMEGYRVVTAGSGRSALAILRGADALPALILLDLMMPEMSGWEFRAVQLADAALAAIPVVVMTASRNLDRHRIDADAVLLKPVSLDDLLAQVAALVCA